MRNRTTLLFSGMLVALTSMGASLTPEQALSRLQSEGPKRVAAKASTGSKLVYTAVSDNGNNSAYIFNGANGGFMVLSADDLAYPLLGYSDSGTISEKNLSPELLWWLEEYGRQIEWAQKNNRQSAKPKALEGLEAIAPLVKTKWDQDTPYNDMCPIPLTVDGKPYTGGQHAYTGCVATSMAQVMKYFNYPAAGTGTIAYTPQRTGYTFDRMTWNLAKHPFEWDKMLDVYSSGNYTDEQGVAVANLMKSCGMAVNMSYGLDASGASGWSIASALRKYFLYDDNCRAEYRTLYSSDQWAQMIYDNLKNIGPVIMNGQSPSDGGHSFICDGYDGKGFFHFNWGWSGMSDGYFLLEALNPDAQGIGGYAGGFNFSQNAIFGAKPPVEGQTGYNDPVRVYQYGALTATVTGKSMKFGVKDYYILGWGNASDRDMNENIGAIFENVNNPQDRHVVSGYLANGTSRLTTITLGVGGYYPATNASPIVDIPNLLDGDYKVTVACYDNNCNVKEWIPVAAPWGYPNYVILTVKDGKYTIANQDIAKLVINSAEIVTDLYYGRFFKIKANITNNSDIELTQYFSPALYSGTKQMFSGESVGISVEPGKTIDYEWVSKVSANAGVSAPSKDTEYTFGLYNPDINANKEVYGYYGTVTLKPTPSSNPRLSITEFNVAGETVEYKENDRDLTTILVSDPENVEVTFSYKDNLGFFDGVMKLSLSYRLPGEYATYPVIDEIVTSQPFLTSGQSDTMTAKFSIPNPIAGVMYQVNAQYTLNSRWNTFGSKGFITGFSDSGVNEIFTEKANDAEPVYYNLQGQKLLNPVKGEVVIMKKGNKTKKIVF